MLIWKKQPVKMDKFLTESACFLLFLPKSPALRLSKIDRSVN